MIQWQVDAFTARYDFRHDHPLDANPISGEIKTNIDSKKDNLPWPGSRLRMHMYVYIEIEYPTFHAGSWGLL